MQQTRGVVSFVVFCLLWLSYAIACVVVEDMLIILHGPWHDIVHSSLIVSVFYVGLVNCVAAVLLGRMAYEKLVKNGYLPEEKRAD